MKKPVLVCLNNASRTLTRYVPKPTGGFYTERFEIIDEEGFRASLGPQTMEQVRLGRMRGTGETPGDLQDQSEVA